MFDYPRWIAHRGGGSAAPENTLAALGAGAAAGFHGVEFDLMLAADGVPILMHDERLGRTLRGRGRVNALSSRQLAAMDAGSWHSPGFAAEGVPSLEQAFARCLALGLWMNLEIKPARGLARRTGEVVAQQAARLAAAAGLQGKQLPVLSSFSLLALEAAAQAAPDLPRALLLSRWQDDAFDLAQSLGVVGLHLNQRMLDQRLLERVKAQGLGVFCYTVNDAERARALLQWGVDAICTDQLSLPGELCGNLA